MSLRPISWTACLLLIAGCLIGCQGQALFKSGSDQPNGAGGTPDFGGLPSDAPATPSNGVTTLPEVLPPFSPPPTRLRTLVSTQYLNALRDLLGPAAASAASAPPDSELKGYNSIGATQFSISTLAATDYEQSAYAAAKAALADPARRAQLIGCTPASPTDDACWTGFVRRFGRLAWRGQLTAADVEPLVTLGKSAATAYASFYSGAEFAIAAMLQSARFLYQVELGVAAPDHPGMVKLTGVELASRMSFVLTNTTPSADLLAVAEAGELDTVPGLRDHAAQLMAGADGLSFAADFFSEYLDLPRLAGIQKDTAKYPLFSTALTRDLAQETRTFVSALANEDGDFRTVLDADYTYVSPVLADLYRVAKPASGFVKTPLPADSRRGGILGQGAFLALLAHNDSSSPTLRGRFVREQVLCQSIPPPPPGVVTILPAVDPNNPMTARQRLAVHQQDPLCASCHGLMDAIGLGLENFDTLGAFRTTEFGLPIDALSQLDTLGSFTGARELGTLLKNQDRVNECMVRNVFRYALGHLELNGELLPLKSIVDAYVSSGYRLRALLMELIASDAFRYAGVDSTVGGP